MVTKWLPAIFGLVTSLDTSNPCGPSNGHCDVDSAAYLQSRASNLAFRAELGANRSLAELEDVIDSGLCLQDTLNSGECISKTGQVDQCIDCSNANNKQIPTDAAQTRFPGGRLLCENEIDGSSSACTQSQSGNFLEFKDSDDYMVCKGYQTCFSKWYVKNVGALCCSVESAGGQTCAGEAVVELNNATSDSGTCMNDMCCDGYQTCDSSNAKFTGIHDLSCRGVQVCSDGVFEVGRNLYCNGDSLVSDNTATGDTCKQAKFTFTQPGDHYVACLGKAVCSSSSGEFNFEEAGGGTIYQDCTGNPGTSGVGTCDSMQVTVPKDSDMYLRCKGSQACQSATFDLKGTSSQAASLYLICDGSQACDSIDITKNGDAKCYCYQTNGGSCPADGDPDEDGKCERLDNPPTFPTFGDSACCAGDSSGAAKADRHPQCNNCGCTRSTTMSTTSTGQGGGDPHIDTFDGQHYLLLKQGSFSFWRYSGSDAEVLSAKKLLKKVPVDFKMYAHYSGHTSYTKGLLLVDSSGGPLSRALEMTSEDCTWRTKTTGAWTKVEEPQLLSMPDADGDEMTAFRMTEPSKGKKMYVELLTKKTDGVFKQIGNLYVRCKPGYHINMKIAMTSKEDIGLVQGQLGSGHTAAGESHASFLQGTRLRSDAEFVVSEKWTDLGGSEEAATYLREVDDEGPAFLKACSQGEENEAIRICTKYLGAASNGEAQSFQRRFQNCVFDVCHGGGEVAAELAAEIFDA